MTQLTNRLHIRNVRKLLCLSDLTNYVRIQGLSLGMTVSPINDLCSVSVPGA